MRRLVRSALYVPGVAPELWSKALASGTDSVIVDLEDAVPPAAKVATRDAVAAWLHESTPPPSARVWVRVNPGVLGEADLAAIAGAPALTGVVLAKTESAADVAAAGDTLSAAGDRTTLLMPLVESAAALLHARAIAAGPRVHRLQIGEVDLAADLAVEPSDDESELLWARSSVVVASRAAGIEPPIGAVSRVFRDVDALTATTHRLRRLGFVGRACIHPAQIDVVNAAFTPTPGEVERAHALVAAFDAAVAAGSGVLVDDEGAMVDEAVVRAARRTLAVAEV